MIQGVVLIVNLLSRNLAQYIGSYIAQFVDMILNWIYTNKENKWIKRRAITRHYVNVNTALKIFSLKEIWKDNKSKVSSLYLRKDSLKISQIKVQNDIKSSEYQIHTISLSILKHQIYRLI